MFTDLGNKKQILLIEQTIEWKTKGMVHWLKGASVNKLAKIQQGNLEDKTNVW